MVKPPPCNQYPGSHHLVTSKTGLKFCRKAKPKTNKANQSKPKPKPKPKTKTNINKANINYLRRLTGNIPLSSLNRVSKLLYNKSTHNSVYKSKKNANNEAKAAAARGMLPKYTINQIRASRLEAIRSAEMLRRRLGLYVINR